MAQGVDVTKLGKLARAGLLAALPLAIAGCATTSSGPEIDPVMATVFNQTGRTISSINYQQCGSAAESWLALPVGAIGSGGRAQFQLPAPCVNLIAYYEDGRTAGTQTGVRRDFPFQWTLR